MNIAEDLKKEPQTAKESPDEDVLNSVSSYDGNWKSENAFQGERSQNFVKKFALNKNMWFSHGGQLQGVPFKMDQKFRIDR